MGSVVPAILSCYRMTWESFDFNIDHILGRYLTSVRSGTGRCERCEGCETVRPKVRGCDGSRSIERRETDLQVGLRRSHSFRESPYWRTFRPGRCGSATLPSRRSPYTLSDANGTRVLRQDEAAEMRTVEIGERVRDAAVHGFRCVSASPVFGAQRPADLEVGPLLQAPTGPTRPTNVPV